MKPWRLRHFEWRILLGYAVSIFWGLAAAPTFSQSTNIPANAVWRFLASGLDAPANWRSPTFDDSAWPAGMAPLGHGGDGEATVTWSGPGPAPVTTYFRHSFVLTEARPFTNLTLRIRRDDGLVVYVNGYEILRRNLPYVVLNAFTPALEAVEGAVETVPEQLGAYPYYFAAGTNTVAVELHQSANGLQDSGFALELIGNLPLTPPTAEITSPAYGALLNPGLNVVSTAVGDLDGHIYLVRFYTNGVPAEYKLAPPYSFDWYEPTPGRYALSVQAFDNSGRSTFSETVQVQVGNVVGDRLVRGPYLQSGSTTSAVVRWRTDWLTASVVRYGTNALSLDHDYNDADVVVDHEVRLTGLRPDTKYFYSIGTASNVLAGGNEYFFRTSPTNTKPFRAWVIGDSGTANANAAAVRDAYLDFTSVHTDVWLMLGDNAYEEGTDGQYQAAVFDMYPTLLRNIMLWPTIGNHDAATVGAGGELPFQDIFTLPRAGESGGLPSGTERYYSFDFANAHFICLDSATSARTPGSPMLTWLEHDLAATDRDWIIAYWHHPPYSFGTHNSDSELELIEMRQHVLPILERFGVDLVLAGHSHNYERSFLLNGFYGTSGDLSGWMVVNDGSGRESEDGPYEKPAGGLGANRGAVYAVCGCSGEGGNFPFLRHPAMYVNYSGFGSIVLDIDGLRLDAKFLRPSSEVDDSFTITKGMPTASERPAIEIARRDGQTELRWPTSLMSFGLESAAQLGPGPNWQAVPASIQTTGRQHRVTIDAGDGARMFRLRSAP